MASTHEMTESERLTRFNPRAQNSQRNIDRKRALAWGAFWTALGSASALVAWVSQLDLSAPSHYREPVKPYVAPTVDQMAKHMQTADYLSQRGGYAETQQRDRLARVESEVARQIEASRERDRVIEQNMAAARTARIEAEAKAKIAASGNVEYIKRFTRSTELYSPVGPFSPEPFKDLTAPRKEPLPSEVLRARLNSGADDFKVNLKALKDEINGVNRLARPDLFPNERKDLQIDFDAYYRQQGLGIPMPPPPKPPAPRPFAAAEQR